MGSSGQERKWRLDVLNWPGPDRERWGLNRDLVSASPDRRFACVLYSCAEVNAAGSEVGLLALLKGPPDTPTVIFRPPNFTCCADDPRYVQWLDGGRFCMVKPWALPGLTFLDVYNETFAHYQNLDYLESLDFVIVEDQGHWVVQSLDPYGGRAEKRIVPEQLTWGAWASLGATSPPRLSRLLAWLLRLIGQPFIEVPYR